MRIQIIHHEANFLHMGRMLINQFLDKVCPIPLGPLRRDLGMPLTSSGLKSHKNVCRPLALLLGVIPQWLARFRGERNTNFPNQLGGHCIHTHLGILRIIRCFIDISDFFHVTDEGGLLL
jgi:hypothetical protein